MRQRTLHIRMDSPLWGLLYRTRALLNRKLKNAGMKPLSIGATASAVLEQALLDNAEDIKREYEQTEQQQLQEWLQPLLGEEWAEASGLPILPNPRRTRSRRSHRSRRTATKARRTI